MFSLVSPGMFAKSRLQIDTNWLKNFGSISAHTGHCLIQIIIITVYTPDNIINACWANVDSSEIRPGKFSVNTFC